jgi:hypothetical protein
VGRNARCKVGFEAKDWRGSTKLICHSGNARCKSCFQTMAWRGMEWSLTHAAWYAGVVVGARMRHGEGNGLLCISRICVQGKHEDFQRKRSNRPGVENTGFGLEPNSHLDNAVAVLSGGMGLLTLLGSQTRHLQCIHAERTA